MPVVLALLSGLLWGAADFVGGLASRTRPAYAVVAGSQAVGLVLIAAVAVAARSWQDPTGWLWWSVLAGVTGTVGLVCFYAALAIGTMGVVSPIAALGAVVPVLLGLATGDEPSGLQLAGVVVAMAGVVAASGPELSGSAGVRPLLLAAAAGVGFGLALFCIDRGAADSSVMTLVGMRATSVSAFLVVALVARSLGGLRPRDLGVLAVVGGGDVGANLLYAVASTLGLVSVVSVLGSLYPVVTVLLARFVLHERLRPVQQLGVGVAMVGVALLAAG